MLMKQEDIEKAAFENILFNHRTADISLGGESLSTFGQKCFCEGVQWLISIVWHDKSEEPRPGKLLLIDSYGFYEVCYREDRKMWRAKRWAYIEDLIPGKED